ncbi:beta-galactosidase [uncultured Mucilaginibacter sp.]|uniref:beta-galactosidase n=1 Tax=uncultured Mucilaginibacter sp. TaxID=797541 RepID=UPI0025EE1C5D|nr:beta-galactosidase [uncultured Mucilaginibacter sp.]
MKRSGFILTILSLLAIHANAQKIYSIDASKVSPDVKSGYFKMGNPGPAGKQLQVNSRYLTLNGVPQIPVMGELQFSRMAQDRWEDEILKMKACGVNIIATYVFWNHHEEIEGQFDWQGNKDLRSFVKLCQKLGVLVYPRIGPWAHGEARNGGTPDWLLRKKYLNDRSLDPVYDQYVDRYFKQIGLQLKGLMYKDGGPIVGVQLENEYWHGKQGEPYIMWLKQTALKYGIDVPLYTVTGWGDGSVPKNEVIPMWGGYPDESWDPDINRITGCDNYHFSSFRGDTTIGNAQVKSKDGYDYSLDPYFTVEMGVGIFNSIQRRPVLGRIDGLGMIQARIGSGGNLLGYYIFAGGSNPLGIYSTNQEDKDETGSWSELSPISYDFQAAIKENGLLAPSYWEVKKFDYFLNEFGPQLAPMEPVFEPKTDEELQYSVRAKDNSGFLFGINYCRNNRVSEKKQVSFKVKLKDETISFPSKPVNIPDSSLFIWPLNLDMDGTKLIYATAQPLFKTDDLSQWIFIEDAAKYPEVCLDASDIQNVTSANGNVAKNDGRYLVTDLKPGTDCVISITKSNGKEQKLIVLSKREGREAWILTGVAGKKSFFISRAGLYMKDNELHAADTVANIQVKMLANAGTYITSNESNFASGKPYGVFNTYFIKFTPKNIPCTLKPKSPLADADWLVTGVKSIDPSTLLYHKEFQKEFSSDDPANVKSAKLIVYPESDCRFRVNEKWVNQPITPGVLNVIDITGYVNKGDNVLLADFPYVKGDKAFAAKVVIEYFNTNRTEFSSDTSWLSTDLYYYPATYGTKPVFPLGLGKPQMTTAHNIAANAAMQGVKEWTVPVPCDYLDGLNNLYLAVKYKGDRISVRSNNKLIADDLNNNTEWVMNLKRDGSQLECRDLQLEIQPWKNIDKIYFDIAPAKTDEGVSAIQSIRFVPEYKAILSINNKQ